ncbi:hypothetical protein CFIO01_08010 [Colletotrichum fioriniae PJ7]|uniref:Uncharacterized protein n=1 Tax=Colletotrichum fioriniae PJ7 TaxID=1445577 RepID=A0A010RUA5_9PEZI|nr:hypothetical protein CFIO01_08010 [Colletotrichum fioriniae PJ7]
MGHHKSSGSKGQGGSHRKSHGSSSGGKKQYIEREVWYCAFASRAPVNMVHTTPTLTHTVPMSAVDTSAATIARPG